jgi:ectoine hydroxylase-related dioxygenase (phytanoyl-CoA dioxygenase family)
VSAGLHPMFNAEDRAHYDEHGYVLVKHAVSAAMLDDVSRMVEAAFRKFNPCAGAFRERAFDDPDFHAAMLAFRRERPAEFGVMFDTVQTSVALGRFGTDPGVVELAAALVNDCPSGLSATDLLLRMDAPRDTRNKLAWHQDSSYFRQNARGENGCVCSVALKQVTIEEGALEILPGSHRLGRIEVARTGGDSAIASVQYRVPDRYTAGATPLAVPLEAGDAIFFNFDLIHRSGSNVSNGLRFTAIARFHRMFTDDFVPGRLVYTPSKTVARPARAGMGVPDAPVVADGVGASVGEF